MPRGKVVVVDDDPVICAQLQDWLDMLGFEVHVLSRGFGATSLILKYRPDLLILDVEMPGLAGEALAKIIAERQADDHKMSVVFYSSKPRKELETVARRCGAVGFIEKTGQFVEFRDKLLALLELAA